MSKFTPGPWIENGKSPSGYSVICRGPIIGWNIAVAMPGASLVARESQNEMEANARLISAAPDLLESCSNAMGILFEHNGNEREKAARKILAKAIANAEGKEGKED